MHAPESRDTADVIWLLPLLLSLLAHGAVLGAFLYFGSTGRPTNEPDPERPEPVTMQLRFVSSVPGPPEPVEPAPAPDAVPLPDAIITPSEAVAPVDRGGQLSMRPENPVNIPAVPVVPDSPETEASRPRLPSVLGLRQLVEDIAEEGGMTREECNRLQQVNELIQCRGVGPDFSRIDRNAVVDYFNPAIGPSRSRTTARITASEAGQVAQQLQAAGLSRDLTEFLRYNQLVTEQTVTGTYRIPGNGVTDMINLHNPTYQMIKRVMGQ